MVVPFFMQKILNQMNNNDKTFNRTLLLTALCFMVNVMLAFLAPWPYKWYHIAISIYSTGHLYFLWQVSPLFNTAEDDEYADWEMM
jgi:hypothetical protein